MANVRLEDCQTLRYHNSCGILHTQSIISEDENQAQDVPLLALVIAFKSYLEHGPSRDVFPKFKSIVNCRGDLAIIGAPCTDSPDHDVWHSYRFVVSTSIWTSADLKDNKGYAVVFKDLVNPYVDAMMRSEAKVDIITALGGLKRKLEELE